MNNNFLPEEIVRILKTGTNREVDEVTSFLYKKYSTKVKSYVFQQGNYKLDADDIFQEVLLKFLALVRAEKFSAYSEPEMNSFMISISRNVVRKIFEADSRRSERDNKFHNLNAGYDDDNPMNALLEEEIQLSAITVFNKLDLYCRNIIAAFYNEKLSLLEIAQKYELTSEKAAKVKKWRCMKTLKELAIKLKF